MKWIAPIFFSVVLSSLFALAAEPPRIDGTSLATFEASLEKVTESVKPTEAQEEFIAIFALVAGEEINLTEDDPDGKLLNGRLAKKLHGMTAAEIVTKYKPLLEKSRKAASGI